MIIHTDFTGGNIIVERIEEHTVYVERDIRDTEGDWFYWAFCVEPFTNRFCSFLCEETAEIHLN